MQRLTVKIIGAFLILVLAMEFIKPLHAVADPGDVTISGQVTYQPRNWDPNNPNMQIGGELKIELFEKDSLGIGHLVDSKYTDINGNFTFNPPTNWWTPDKNIYFQVTTVYTDTAVTNTIGQQYGFLNNTTLLSHDGPWTIDFPITENWPSFQAIWIFEDMRKAWNYVYDHDFRNGVPYDPGSVTAQWEDGIDCYAALSICNSFTWAGVGTHFIFINNFNNNSSMDVVVHETGHMFMYNANQWWYPDSSCWYHSMFTSINTNCAWSEGWADFFPMAVNSDHCYNQSAINPCTGIADQDYYDLEEHSKLDDPKFPFGDTVEGRVAAALYDLYDLNNEGYDRQTNFFFPISQIALGSSQVETLQDFWNDWISSGRDQSRSGLTFWWNTINYINILWTFLPVARK
jgi:hypothetical protein